MSTTRPLRRHRRAVAAVALTLAGLTAGSGVAGASDSGSYVDQLRAGRQITSTLGPAPLDTLVKTDATPSRFPTPIAPSGLTKTDVCFISVNGTFVPARGPLCRP